jgi:hypothetical protein
VARLLFLTMSVAILAVPRVETAVTFTSSADFRRGNNEGLVSVAEDRLTRGRITAGDVGEWTFTRSLPEWRSHGPAVAYNGFVYLTGGLGAGAYYTPYAKSSVYVSSLNADGSLGPWSSTTSFSGQKRNHQSLAYNGHLYVMGGGTTIWPWLQDIQVARIQDDGSVGAWSATTPLPHPAGLTQFAAVARNNYLYVIGGSTDNALKVAEVYVAPIHADGGLGVWSAVTALPAGTSGHDAVAYDGHLYVLGGDDPNPGLLSRVLVAPFNADGSIGSWSDTTPLPSPRKSHKAAAYNGFLYCIGGGLSSSQHFGDVLVAPLNADGSVGEWSASTAISPAREGAFSIVHDGFLYVIGGMIPGQYLTDSLVFPILSDTTNSHQSPERLRGFHSLVADLQGDASTRFITINGHLSPGGAIRLQARVAPEADGAFGEETVFDSVAPGSALEVPGNGRHVWLRLTLDDTGTSDADQPTFVTDVTISPDGLSVPAESPAPPVNDDDDDENCVAGASAVPGSWLALLVGLALLASARRGMPCRKR